MQHKKKEKKNQIKTKASHTRTCQYTHKCIHTHHTHLYTIACVLNSMEMENNPSPQMIVTCFHASVS